MIHGTDEIEIVVERGMPDGHRITFARGGDQMEDIDIAPGDVVYTIRTQPYGARFSTEICGLGRQFSLTHLLGLKPSMRVIQ